MNPIETRLVHSLVESGIIPRSALQFGEEFVMRRIQKSFDQVAKLESLNPDRIVGARLVQFRGRMKQEQLVKAVNGHLELIGAKPVGSRTSLSRIEHGKFSLDYKVGLAIAYELCLPPEAFSPWDWGDSFASFRGLREPQSLEESRRWS